MVSPAVNQYNPVTKKWEAIGGGAYIGTTAPTSPVILPVQTSINKNFMGGDPGLPGGIDRKAPMVATSQNPAVPMGNTSFTYDETNPKDYIYNIIGKQQVGKTLTQEEYTNYLRAIDKSNELKAQANPYENNQYGADLLAQQTAAREAEKTRDSTALEAFKAQKEVENTAKIKLLEQQGVKQQDAAQRVLSFSGFGRSTSAATQMSDIQANTNQAINMANAANEAEIAKYKAELEGADSDTLKALNDQISEYNKAAQTRQLESIKKTAEANQKNTVSFEDALKNLGDTSNAAGIDIGDTKDLAFYGSMVRNADGTVNEEKLKTLPENVQALIRLAAQTSSATEAPKIENIGTTKNPRYVQWNGKDRIPVAGGYTAGGGGSGGGKGSGISAAGVGATGNALDLIDYNNVKFKNDPQTTAFTYATRLIQSNEVFNSLEDSISGMSKAEFIKQKALGMLPYGSALQSDVVQQQEQAERNFINATLRKESGAAIADSEYASAQKQYLPQPGDTAATLEQKRQNRIATLKGIATSSGNIKALQPAINKVTQKSSTPAPSNTGGTLPKYNAGTKYKVGDIFTKDGKTYKVDANLDYKQQ